MSSVLVYAGLLAAALGALVALFPIRRLGLGRRLGATALLAGAVALAAGLLMPPRRETPAAERQHMDRFLPVYDVNEVNSIRIRATPARIDEAIRTTRAGEVRLLAPLFWLRSLPGRLAGAGGEVPESDEILVPAAGQRGGFLLLHHQHDEEIVVGIVGRFWELRGAPVVLIETPEEFQRFQVDGLAKATMNFLIQPEDGGVYRLSTETRVFVADDGRGRFLLYWKFIHPGSAMLRLSWLQAVKRRAEAPR